jgi:shikimate kinase
MNRKVINKIFLIGFMGSGKTSLAAEISKLHNLPSLDMDQLLEDRLKKKIHLIFEENGEAYFRDAEHELLKEICKMDCGIIATGGGTPCFHHNMKLINHSGISVYLKCTADELFNWLKDHRNNRPLVSDKNETELKKYIAAELARREPYYCLANITVEAYKTSSSEILNTVSEFKK